MPEPTKTAVKTEAAVKTAYHVLRRTSKRGTDPNALSGAKDAFELVGRDITASSAAAAIRAYAAKAADHAAGSYVAVPSRSFTEQTVTIETQTILKLTG